MEVSVIKDLVRSQSLTLAREISKENPGKIYFAITNCKARYEYDVRYKSHYMKRKENLDVELDENGRKRHKRHKCYFSGRKMHATYTGGKKPHATLENGRKPHATANYTSGRKMHATYTSERKPHATATYTSGRKMHPTYTSGRKPHATLENGRKRSQPLVNDNDPYIVQCKHCCTVRSVSNAPKILMCKGVCKKSYMCNLELKSNKHWKVIIRN